MVAYDGSYSVCTAGSGGGNNNGVDGDGDGDGDASLCPGGSFVLNLFCSVCFFLPIFFLLFRADKLSQRSVRGGMEREQSGSF